MYDFADILNAWPRERVEELFASITADDVTAALTRGLRARGMMPVGPSSPMGDSRVTLSPTITCKLLASSRPTMMLGWTLAAGWMAACTAGSMSLGTLSAGPLK